MLGPEQHAEYLQEIQDITNEFDKKIANVLANQLKNIF
jgi:hypothetical protein